MTFEPNCRGCDKIRQDDKHENVIDSNEHNITSKLLRIFKSKKWSRQKTTTTRNNEIVFDKPLSFPKVKLRKNAPPQVQSAIGPGSNGNNLTKRAEMNLINKTPLKISKSLPVRKPTIVWEEIQEFQKLLPIKDDFRDEEDEVRITVGTQTEISWMRSGLEHRRLERTSLTNQRPDLKTLANEVTRLSINQQQQPTAITQQQYKRVSLDLTKSSDDDECNLEVFKTICGGGSQGDSAQSSLMSTSSRSRDVDGISSVIR